MEKNVQSEQKKVRREKRERGQTLQSMGMKILVPVFFALFGLLTCLFIGLIETRRLASQYAKDTAELYVDQINYDIVQISTELVLVLENSEIGRAHV